MEQGNNISLYSPHLFWDTNRETLDFDVNKSYIIKQVLEYGYDSDWDLLKKQYGLAEIKDCAIKMRTLEKKAASFIACITQTDIKEFRCYTTTQSRPQLWNY